MTGRLSSALGDTDVPSGVSGHGGGSAQAWAEDEQTGIQAAGEQGLDTLLPGMADHQLAAQRLHGHGVRGFCRVRHCTLTCLWLQTSHRRGPARCRSYRGERGPP